jgi:hypothetical protein
MFLVALAGAVPLGSAFFMEGCGSGPAVADRATRVGGAAQDASLDSGDAGIDSVDADADVPLAPCPDAGGVITINGDGVAQALRYNSFPSVFHDGDPSVPWAVAYYGQGLAIGGSGNPDGGANLKFDIEITEDPDGGLTILGPGSSYRYAYYTRQDGTVFSPTSPLAASVTLTEAGPPGGVVAGSYTVTVVDSAQPDAGILSLSGTFSTCRLRDSGGPTPAHP